MRAARGWKPAVRPRHYEVVRTIERTAQFRLAAERHDLHCNIDRAEFRAEAAVRGHPGAEWKNLMILNGACRVAN
jgi:hypothetical protein